MAAANNIFTYTTSCWTKAVLYFPLLTLTPFAPHGLIKPTASNLEKSRPNFNLVTSYSFPTLRMWSERKGRPD